MTLHKAFSNSAPSICAFGTFALSFRFDVGPYSAALGLGGGGGGELQQAGGRLRA